MTLQSQAPRTTPVRTSVMPAQRKSVLTPTTLIAMAGVGVVVIASTIFVISRIRSSGPIQPSPGDPLNQPLAGGTGGAPAATPTGPGHAAPAKPKPRTEPASIEMGREASTPLVQGPAPANPPTSTPANTTPAPATEPATQPVTPPGDAVHPEPSQPLIPGNTPAPGGPGGGFSPTGGGGGMSDARMLVEQATRAQGSGNLVEARALLNRALLDGRVPASERQAIRLQMASISESLVFSPTVAKGDVFCDTYTIQSGDNLVNVRAKQSLPVDWRFLQRVNMVNPNALKIGQKLKLIRQPFHAVVHKNDYRLDLYIGDPLPAGGSMGAQVGPDGQDPSWIYVRSFDVGLGESNGTPEGLFVVRPRSKLVNPPWVNPRTGEKFAADDPKNPIGEFWVGLEGADESTRKFTGYGVHGTIDPDSVGKQKSMGCVRLRNDDVALIYEVLTERMSTVKIMK